jgi:hypothetical protein
MDICDAVAVTLAVNIIIIIKKNVFTKEEKNSCSASAKVCFDILDHALFNPIQLFKKYLLCKVLTRSHCRHFVPKEFLPGLKKSGIAASQKR